MGFVQKEVRYIWTFCWKIPGYCCLKSGKSSVPFWTSIFLICEMARFVSKLQESMCFWIFQLISILGDVFPWVVELQCLEGRSGVTLLNIIALIATWSWESDLI